MDSVWQLETPSELDACNLMHLLYEQARKGKVSSRNLLKRCYGDSWETIKERMETEGSVWYVWYMDGVRNLLWGRV
mgnify:CR=1 FL=1